MNQTENPKEKDKKEAPAPEEEFSVLLSREVVALPGVMVPIYVNRGIGADAIDFAIEQDQPLILAYQTGDASEPPSKRNIEKTGALARVVHCVKLSNGDAKVRVHVQGRAQIKNIISLEPFIRVKVSILERKSVLKLTQKEEKLLDEIKNNFSMLGNFDQTASDLIPTAKELFDPGDLADLIASTLPLEPSELQVVLAEFDGMKRIKVVAAYLEKQVGRSSLRENLSVRAHNEMERLQREELLREQMRQIQSELGEEADYDNELGELADRLKKAKMPAGAKKAAEKQMRRLRFLHADTSEAALARTYLEWILDLPWSKRTKDKLDLVQARKILDEDHYGLEKTKERILDFLGVRKLRKDAKGPILLLVGPPGVGKTSLGRSIARALGRKFFRVALGGLRDEAELRGHRRTYVGALPGRIIQGMNTAGTKNPVFMLDELDKVGSDFRGDPASVLLEILDPEQNKEFDDHYLNIPYDLSEVMFVGTANIVETIPAPLRDRLEIIEIPGYTAQEKIEIAKRYLIPRAKEENGLKDFEIKFGKNAILFLIEGYTRESGVRELSRTISSVFRKVARCIAEEKTPPSRMTPKLIEQFLGSVRYIPDKRLTEDQVGVVTGLAWTEVGGEILPIEVSITKGKGTLNLTGQMGEVMRESAMASLTYVQSEAESLGINTDFYENSTVHVHIPQGAIPKDGPSAGIAIATALVSALTEKPTSRKIAMTGEITLRGNVLPIGGLREKALAALRMGIKTVIIPKDNEREIKEFPKYLRDKIEFLAVNSVQEVFEASLLERVMTREVPTQEQLSMKTPPIPVRKKIKEL